MLVWDGSRKGKKYEEWTGQDSPNIDSQGDSEGKGDVKKLGGIHSDSLSFVCSRGVIYDMSATKRELRRRANRVSSKCSDVDERPY